MQLFLQVSCRSSEISVGVTASHTGYALPPVIATGEKVVTDSLVPLKEEIPVCTGMFIPIAAGEIGEISLEDLMESVSSPTQVLGIFF